MRVTRKEKKKTKHARRTAHRQSMADPRVRKLVDVLRRCWKSMGPIKRGERLRELTTLGCSMRGLEGKLKQSATSIRRHMLLAELPEEDRKAIEAGSSAKKILVQKADAKRKKCQGERIIEDQKTGAISDEVAAIILEFCRAKEGGNRVPRSGESAEKLMIQTLAELFKREASHERVPRVSKKLGMKGLLRKTKPRKDNDEALIAYEAKWLARLVLAKAPERPIWENAIEKAERRVRELTPQKRPSEMWWDGVWRGIRRSEELAAPCVRPVYKGGARSIMERQGRPGPPPKR